MKDIVFKLDGLDIKQVQHFFEAAVESGAEIVDAAGNMTGATIDTLNMENRSSFAYAGVVLGRTILLADEDEHLFDEVSYDLAMEMIKFWSPSCLARKPSNSITPVLSAYAAGPNDTVH